MQRKALLACALLFVSGLSAATAAYRMGAGLRVGAFGVPNALLDLVFYEHPQLAGTAMSFEIHSYGEKGPRSVFSGVYSLEYSRLKGEGYFRVENYDNRVYGQGEAKLVCFTASILMHIFPSSPIHPYIGGGIGVGHMSIWAEGTYQDELGTTIRDTYEKKMFVPVGHIPIGILANFNDKFLLRAEAGFKNGFYFGGGLAVNF